MSCPLCEQSYGVSAQSVAIELLCEHTICTRCMVYREDWTPNTGGIQAGASAQDEPGAVFARASDVDPGTFFHPDQEISGRTVFRERNAGGTGSGGASVECVADLKQQQKNHYLCPTCMEPCPSMIVKALKANCVRSLARAEEEAKPNEEGEKKDYYCTNCDLLISASCGFESHKSHNVVKYCIAKQELQEQLSSAEIALSKRHDALQAAAQNVTTVLKKLRTTADTTRSRASEHFQSVRNKVTEREGQVLAAITAAEETKQNKLSSQLTEFNKEMKTEAMKVAKIQTTRGSSITDDQFSEVRGMVEEFSKLKTEILDLDPASLGDLTVAFEQEEMLFALLGRHGAVVCGEVKPLQCVAVGDGLLQAQTGQPATFGVTVVAQDDNGSQMDASRQQVAIVAVPSGLQGDATETVRLRDTSVTDNGDGTYVVKYVAEGEGELRFDVLVNNHRIPASPFAVQVAIFNVRLHMHAGNLDGDLAFNKNNPGAIRHIGTAGGTRAFENPHTTGDVIASMSSVGRDSDVCRLLQAEGSGLHDGEYNNTGDVGKKGAWVSVDLKRWSLAPEGYCLRSDNNNQSYKLRNWVLEGSVDGQTWTTLKEHKNDTKLHETRFSEASWEIEGFENTRFRHFRVVQTGKDSSSYYMLACAGMEFYGTLYKDC